MDKDTRVWRDDKKVAAIELKAGLRVVVDGYWDSPHDLLAIDVMIAPPIVRAHAK